MLSCLRCGECCKKEPGCLYGSGTPCEHLVEVDGVYACSEVLAAEDRESIEIDLGIGDGCIQPGLRRAR